MRRKLIDSAQLLIRRSSTSLGLTFRSRSCATWCA